MDHLVTLSVGLPHRDPEPLSPISSTPLRFPFALLLASFGGRSRDRFHQVTDCPEAHYFGNRLETIPFVSSPNRVAGLR